MDKKQGGLLLHFKRYWKGLAVCVALLGLGSGVFYFFPLELMELRSRVQLWSGGIREVDFPTSEPRLHGYLKNGCGSTKTPSECVCVAFLHGLGDNGMTWRRLLEARSEIWQKMGLARPAKFLALDLPGSGGSASALRSDQYRVRNQAQTVIQALRTECNQWVLVGSSLGGWVASWVALQWPEGIQRLMLLAPGGFKDTGHSALLLTEPTVAKLKEFQRRAYFKPRMIPEHVWQEIARKARGGHSREIVAAQEEGDYLETRFSTLRIPTLIIWGKADQIIPIDLGRQMRDSLHSIVWREVSECGHLLQKECPLPVMQGIVDLTNLGAM